MWCIQTHKWGNPDIHKASPVPTMIMKQTIFKELFQRPGEKRLDGH